MKTEKRYITRGIQAELSDWLVNLLWFLRDGMEVESKDYLQIFRLSRTATGQHIEHEQEQPPYWKVLDVPCEDAVYCGDDLMCPNCANELTVTCRNCGERVYLDDAYGEDGMRICPSCFENYFVTCDRCGRLVREEYACYADDDEDECYPLCDVCAHIRNQSALHRYDYKPEPIFYGSGLRHFGVELEIDDAGQSSKNAKQIMAVANHEHEHLYAKTDGSLDNGLVRT